MSDEALPPARRSRRGSGAVTLHDVARLAGVAPITASRALNTPGQVSPELVRRVTEAVASTGYVPNRVAGGLASARSRLVAALVPTIAGPVFLETIQALTDALAEAGCQLMLGQSGYGGRREDALIDTIVGRRPDGIVLTGILHSAEARRKLLACGIPVVETWDLTPTPIDMIVGFSHEKVGRAVADFIHARGHRHPAIVTADDHRAGLRRAGFEQRLRELGLDGAADCVVPAPSSLGNGRAGWAELRRQDQRIDVVVCSSDVLAHGVMTEVQAAGLAVPRDVAVMGFGDMPFASHTYPLLSTVHVDGAEIGRQAARFILDRVDNRDPGPKVRDLGFSIIQRASV
ncbi:MAG: LacI family DNA-binding transcriptional regulator [Polaromonas sp.]|nr:LacI family DNA-binding transcriptional regulator [Polaromonas sp.]